MPNFNKKEKEILEICIKKYALENQLESVKLTNKLIIEIIKDAHNKWELITTIPQHKLMDSIRKKCGEHFETIEERQTREERESKIRLRKKAHEMREEVKQKHMEEMEKELAYWGVDEESLKQKLDPDPIKLKPSDGSASRVEIFRGTMDDEDNEEEKEVVISGGLEIDDGIDFIGNISQPVEEEPEPEPEIIEEVIKEEIKETVEVVKEKVIEEIEEVKEAVEDVIEETIKETKKELEIDIDDILNNL